MRNEVIATDGLKGGRTAQVPLNQIDQEWIVIAETKRTKAAGTCLGRLGPGALRHREAWVETVSSIGATHAVTLNWNPNHGWLRPDRVSADVAKLHCRLDRKLTKNRLYHELPMVERTGYVGFIEHCSTNTHAHFAWRVPAEYQAIFADQLLWWWQKLHPYGSAMVRPIFDQAGWGAYISKDEWRRPYSNNAENFLVSHIVII